MESHDSRKSPRNEQRASQTVPATAAAYARVDLTASLLSVLLRGVLVWHLLILGIGFPFVFKNKVGAAMALLPTAVSMLAVPYWLLRRHRVMGAAWVFVVGGTVISTVLVFLSHGVRGPDGILQLAVVVVAGVLLGRNAALWLSAGCLLADLAMAFWERAGGQLPSVFTSTPLAGWFDLAMAFALGAPPMYRALDQLRAVLKKLQTELAERQKIEEALTRSEQRYRDLITNSSEAVWRIECAEPIPVDLPIDEVIQRLHQTGRISECNDAFARMRGWQRADQVVGSPADQIMPLSDPVRLEQVRRVIRAALQNESTELIEEAPDGSVYYRLVAATPILKHGCMVQLWGILTDITQLKEAELALRESDRRYRALFDNSPDAIFLMANGRFVQCNSRSEALFGLPAGKIIGREPHELSPPVQPNGRESKQLARELIERATSGSTQFFEWRHIRANGVPFDAEVGLNPVLLATGTHLLAVVRDITERKQREEELRTLKAQLERENTQLREVIHGEQEAPELVGKSPAMRRVLGDIATVAPTPATVLILGETGVGKELVARAVHQQSLLADSPLITVNCAALTSTLIESEFFGHEKGAFTGAVSRKRGRFELADGGTIFLDEIGDLPLDLQAKLLRVLQSGEFERVGGTETLRVTVRVIAATNRDLQQAITAGAFRADLYYRLNVFPIEVPPLRDRLSDIPQLVEYFLQRFSRSLGKPLTSITPRSYDLLMAHDWPGNVRELFHIVERAAIRTGGTVVEIEDLGISRAHSPEIVTASLRLADMERNHILQALSDTDWVVEGPRGAAQRVGLHPNTLRYRMKKLGIVRPVQN